MIHPSPFALSCLAPRVPSQHHNSPHRMLVTASQILVATGLVGTLAASLHSNHESDLYTNNPALPCPRDMELVTHGADCNGPTSTSCTAECQFKNQYKSCGGFRVASFDCGNGAECQNDPRLPVHCGLACDGPGICVPKGRKACSGTGESCPDGLYCYLEAQENGCDETRGSGSLGYCM